MSAIYNEIDPFAASWLRELASQGHIAPGVIDGRSIADLSPADVTGPGQRHFFAGIGVWSYALRLAGVSDSANVWTGSCPCQPFSPASRGRAAGFDSEKHLWPTWFALIRECRPPVVFGEQVARGLGADWFDGVRTDLERAGYAVAAADLCASLLGFPRRERIFFVAYADANGQRDIAFDAQVACVQSARDVVSRELLRLHELDTDRDGPAAGMAARGGYGNAVVAQLTAAFVTAALESIQHKGPQ